MSDQVQWLGYASAVLTTSSFFPQALKTLRTNNTEDISLRMYVLFTIGISGWGSMASSTGTGRCSGPMW